MSIWQLLGASSVSLQGSCDVFLLTADMVSLPARVNRGHMVSSLLVNGLESSCSTAVCSGILLKLKQRWVPQELGVPRRLARSPSQCPGLDHALEVFVPLSPLAETPIDMPEIRQRASPSLPCCLMLRLISA